MTCAGHWWIIPPLAEKNDEEGRGIALGHCRHCADTRWFRISHAASMDWNRDGANGRHILYPRQRPHQQPITTLADERAW